jgi:hypothetical protein
VWIFFLFWPSKIQGQSNWCRLLPFPSPVPPVLRPTLSCRRVVSHVISIKSKWARCLYFIFQQRFVPSSSLSSQNWSIESAPPPQANLSGPSDSHPLLLEKDHLNHVHSLHHSTASLFCLFPNQSTTPSKLHPLLSFYFTAVPHLSSLHITTPTVMN